MSLFSFRRFQALVCDPYVVRRVLAGLLVIGAAVVIVLAARDTAETTAARRGDFPAFWSMAVIASGENPQRLYDIELQRQIQNAAWPSLKGGLLPAAYPAQLAFVLQPLARFDHRVARWIWTGGALVTAFVAICLFSRGNSRIRWAPWMVFAVLCIFGPCLRGVVGGQVLPFMMCLFALVVMCGRRSSLWTDILLGALLGLWLVKPYYALCALVVPVVQRRWVTLGSFAIVALLSWWLGATVAGPHWLSDWITFSGQFAKLNVDTNAHQMPNLYAQVYRVLGGAGESGVLWWSVMVAAYAGLAAGVSALLGHTTIRALCAEPRRNSDYLFLFVLSLVVVAVPQVNFYDLGIVVCAVLALFDPQRLMDRFVVTVCLGISQISVSPPLGLPLHFILGLAGLSYVCVRIRECVSVRC